MKKTLTVTTLALLAGGVSVYAQGSLTMSDYGGIQIFDQQGSGAAGAVTVTDGAYSGTAVYGYSGDGTYSTSAGNGTYKAGSSLGGSGYSIQLLIGAGSGDALSALGAAGPVISTWYSPYGTATGAAFSGQWESLANVTFGTASEAVTVAIGAWNNEGGTITSLAAAQAAGDPWGVSKTANLTLGGGNVSPVTLPFTGLESFSLVTPIATPEPSTIALGVIGASTLLFRRRK